MHSPEPPNYPRGIINPNYPGFQHLAHTLSEHFIDHHQFENLSDSEISEDFDYDIQNNNNNNNNNVMTCNINNLENGNNINIKPNNNKNNLVVLTTSDEEMENIKIEDDVNMFGDKGRRRRSFELMENHNKSDSNGKRIASAVSGVDDADDDVEECYAASTHANVFEGKHSEEEINQSPNGVSSEMEIEEEHIMLQNVTQDDFIFDCTPVTEKSITLLTAFTSLTDEQLQHPLTDDKDNCDLKQSEIDGLAETILEITDDIKIQNLSTPDILLKHHSPSSCGDKLVDGFYQHTNIITANDTEAELIKNIDCFQPDLIKNISTSKTIYLENELNFDVPDLSNVTVGEANCDTPSSAATAAIADLNRATRPRSVEIQKSVDISTNADYQCITSSSTVDIIGEFGKEIEKEIGLIVSGYTRASGVGAGVGDDDAVDIAAAANDDSNRDMDSTQNEIMEISAAEDKLDNELTRNMTERNIFRKVSKQNILQQKYIYRLSYRLGMGTLSTVLSASQPASQSRQKS